MIVLVEPEEKYLKSYHEAYLKYEANNITDYHFSDDDVADCHKFWSIKTY